MVCEGSLSSNNLGEAGPVALAPALRQLTALQTLEYVGGCSAGDWGVAARGGRRVGAFARWNLWPWLVASAAYAACMGACAVSMCGMWCCVVCEGSLSCNMLGDAGAAALALALPQLTALQRLEYVCGCRVGDGDVGAGLCSCCRGACVWWKVGAMFDLGWCGGQRLRVRRAGERVL